ncbi:MAG: leucyl aminopeptidase [Myxococcales bacterium]|nr:leucyl aminopeptidase [Myxococcales bacterium]
MLRNDWLTSAPLPAHGQLFALALCRESTEKTLEERFGAAILGAARAARFEGKAGQTLQLTREIEGKLQTLLLMGVGDGLARAADVRKLAFDAARAALAVGADHLILDLSGTPHADEAQTGALIAQGAELATYRYDAFLPEDRRPPQSLTQVSVVGRSSAPARGSERGQAIAAAVARARDLVNGPPNLVTPSYLAKVAREIAAAHADTVTCTILDREECERRGMGCYLAVASGSAEPPRFIDLHYRPGSKSKGKICLVGKGVTFDSGGLSLKTSEGMFGMKMDMGGAAAVLAALDGIARLGLPWEVHAIVAATENMPARDAYRPGDVLRASNGKTIEIDNTDAEGRLTLADALTYAGSLGPDFTIDLATLTGACIIALGPHIAGVMGNDDELASAWIAAGERSGESSWRLPLPPELKEQLKSPIASMRNTGDRPGGAITAGLFLSEFTEGQRWIHVDIAGPGMLKKPYGISDEGGSGFGVATILELLSGDI